MSRGLIIVLEPSLMEILQVPRSRSSRSLGFLE